MKPKEKITTYTITESNFLEWYFNTGAYDEQRQTRIDIGFDAVESIIKTGSFHISTTTIWEQCQKCCIYTRYLEEDVGDNITELDDLDHEWDVRLISDNK